MILTFLLLVLTTILCSVFYVVGIIYTVLRSFKHKGLKKYFYQIAFSLDQTGNVVCGPLFNDLLIAPNGHRMGNQDETISHVLGMNLKGNTLYPFGILISKVVDKTAYLMSKEVNHCLNAANNSQKN